MAEIWKGKPVADAMTARMQAEASELSARGVTPTLCIFRVGERPDDLAYERGAVKRCEAVGIRVVRELLPADASQAEFDARFLAVNRDPSVHGILLFRPLPVQLDGEKARRMLDPAKDVDGSPGAGSASPPAPPRPPWSCCATTAWTPRESGPRSSAAPW